MLSLRSILRVAHLRMVEDCTDAREVLRD